MGAFGIILLVIGIIVLVLLAFSVKIVRQANAVEKPPV